MEPAAATSVTEVTRLNLPAETCRKYNPDLDSQAVTPSVPLVAAQDWLAGRGCPGTRSPNVPWFISRFIHLIHLQEQSYTAVVEGATGKVLANIFPQGRDTLSHGGLLTAAYFAAGQLPDHRALIDGAAGFGVGMLVCSARVLWLFRSCLLQQPG